jgi:T5SS/PEP-CTERM-associated repeat protein
LPSFAANISWTGATNGNWNLPGNWGSAVPGAADTVTINIPAGPALDNAAASVSSLTVGKTGTGSLAITGAGVVNSTGLINIGSASGSTGTSTVSGSGSGLTGGSSLRIGESGTGSLAVSNGGGVSTAGSLSIGLNAGATGTATVNGAGSSLSTATELAVGSSGTGSLTVTNGATVSSISFTNIGSRAGSDGTAIINGASSNLTAGSELRVGSSGTGAMTVTNGGAATSTTHTYIGQNANSIGTAAIDGAASSLNIGGELRIGSLGSGSLSVTNGANVASTARIYIGSGTGGTGTAIVDGTGSGLSSGNSLSIGESGAGSLTVKNGGIASSVSTMTIGANPGGAGAVIVEGANSNMTSGNTLRVGNSGAGSLTIKNGGTTSSGNYIYIGSGGSSTGAVIVDGAGSSLKSANTFHVGESGTASLKITNGAVVNSGSHTHIGQQASSHGTTILDGTGSMLTTSNNLYIGNSGSGSLAVTNGAVASSTCFTNIGSAAGSNGIATANGADSKLISASSLNIGNSGTGSLAITNGATVGSGTYTYIGVNAGSSGTVTVSGADSSLTSGGDLRVGSAGTASLTVTNGADVSSAGSIVVGNSAGSRGTASIDGMGSSLISGSTLTVGSANGSTGNLTVSNGGTVQTAGTMRIAHTAGSAGTLNIGSATGNTAVYAGTISASAIAFGAGSGQIVFNHTNGNYVFTPGITGNGALDFLSGTTTLAGNSAGFTGSINITNGILRVNGSLGAAAATSVANNGRFEGTGSIGTLNIHSGGTFAPGNSIGTTNVANATFNPGSVYEVELNASGQSDFLNAAGPVTINGGEVRVTPYPDYRTGIAYTIITAGGGVTGTFDSVISPTIFFTGNLSYIGNNVLLTLAPRMGLAQTRNQNTVFRAALQTNGNAAINTLLNLTDEAAVRAGLDALSGELHTSLAAVQIGNQSRLQGAALRRRTNIAGKKESGTVWISAYGELGKIKSDGNAAAIKEHAGGAIIGAEKQLPKGHVGLGIGAGSGTTEISARSSKARSDDYTFITYGEHFLGGGFFLDGFASATRHEIETSRSITVNGYNGESNADYSANTQHVSAQISRPATCPSGKNTTAIRPYAGISYTRHHAGKFEETGEAGLQGDNDISHTGTTSLGIDISHEIALEEKKRLVFTGGLEWQHLIGSDNTERRLSFRDSTGPEMTVQGAPLARDTTRFHAGMDMETGGVNFSVNYGAAIAPDNSSHSLTARMGVKF